MSLTPFTVVNVHKDLFLTLYFVFIITFYFFPFPPLIGDKTLFVQILLYSGSLVGKSTFYFKLSIHYHYLRPIVVLIFPFNIKQKPQLTFIFISISACPPMSNLHSDYSSCGFGAKEGICDKCLSLHSRVHNLIDFNEVILWSGIIGMGNSS